MVSSSSEDDSPRHGRRQPTTESDDSDNDDRTGTGKDKGKGKGNKDCKAGPKDDNGKGKGKSTTYERWSGAAFVQGQRRIVYDNN